jgi:hypothetical protein
LVSVNLTLYADVMMELGLELRDAIPQRAIERLCHDR